MNEIYALLSQVQGEPVELAEVKTILECILCSPDVTFSYSDLYPEIKNPVPEEKRRIYELLRFYDFEPKLEKQNRRLILMLSKREFFWCKRHLKVLSAGWLYLLYSSVLKEWKVGMTESTMKRRLTNYRKVEQWRELKSCFCSKYLRKREGELKRFCNLRYQSSRGDEFFIFKNGEVEIVKEIMDFLCL